MTDDSLLPEQEEGRLDRSCRLYVYIKGEDDDEAARPRGRVCRRRLEESMVYSLSVVGHRTVGPTQ